MDIQYAESIRAVQQADNALDIERAIKTLIQLRTTLQTYYPESMDSITDIDYYIACGAFRLNNSAQFEDVVQRHYYDDSRFKRLYQIYMDVKTTNDWRHIVKTNASHLEKTFIRSLSVVILTGICISLVLRK